MKYTKKQIETISKGEPIEIAGFITTLLEQNEALMEQNNALMEQNSRLEKQVKKLTTRVKELERQVGLNSRNSSKPPSSDGLRKPKSLRSSGGKKGAPKGHEGHTLKMSETPDEIVWHEPETCSHCKHSLRDEPVVSHTGRQVVDLPPLNLKFVEHRSVSKCCPNCGSSERAPFPNQVKAPVQYGEGWSAWTAYLHNYQLLPLDRISQLYEDLTGHRPSEATLLSHLHRLSKRIEPVEAEIRQALHEASVIHADETGMRIEGKLHWLHVISNQHWTLYNVHPKRGKKAVDDIGFLPQYQGTVIHDCWATYFNEKYKFNHGLCGVHLLRECQGIIDYDHHEWASKMQELLRNALREKRKALESGKPISLDVISAIESRYDSILQEGAREWFTPSDPNQPVKKGRKKKSKAANLAERFTRYKVGILRFLRDELVPFDNSQAERDIRMMKVKEKISGSFRTMNGAEQFTRIRGFISTLRKQGRNLFDSLELAIRGQFSFS